MWKTMNNGEKMQLGESFPWQQPQRLRHMFSELRKFAEESFGSLLLSDIVLEKLHCR